MVLVDSSSPVPAAQFLTPSLNPQPLAMSLLLLQGRVHFPIPRC